MSYPVSSRAAQRDWVKLILGLLEAEYGRPQWKPTRKPLDQLVGTILSQNTSDTNSLRAFEDLRRAFPTWDEVRQADIDTVATAIRRGGLAQRKARIIQSALQSVEEETTFDGIEDLPLPEAKARLTALPGVGPKTAACVLLFALGRPALPVDTHVYRVTRRLGIIDSTVSAEAAHDRLETLIDPCDVYSFHVNLIRHGRTICVARAPKCAECVLAEHCAFALQQQMSARVARETAPTEKDG